MKHCGFKEWTTSRSIIETEDGGVKFFLNCINPVWWCSLLFTRCACALEKEDN